ncbi:TetR/AcrR family transcriptional regulator [Streptosporangium sp. CA-135522]|uniref:TetR/AcrR family transcriptional regulator n=1 Tax=Streptosporangium sp. CA-135522 TaxID=3240072 RepID=UPI003D8AA4BE
MGVSDTVATGGARARSNRQRILAVAATELSRNPQASMDDVARAAGVVRRTLYGHFPSRDALIEGITEQAAREIAEAFHRGQTDTDSPVEAMARFTLAVWEVGDRYRLLIALAQRNLTGAGIHDLLRPVREKAAELLESGQRLGVFSDHLPAPVLSYAVESMTMGLLQAVNDGAWKNGDPEAAATACLIAVGVPAGGAASAVERIAATRT